MAAKVYKSSQGKREKEPCHFVGTEFRFSLLAQAIKRFDTLIHVKSHQIFYLAHLLPTTSLFQDKKKPEKSQPHGVPR